MFHPTWPSGAAFDRLEGQLSLLRNGCKIDDASDSVSCLNLPLDEAREIVAGIWWKRCNLQSSLICHREPEVHQRLKQGSHVLRDHFLVQPVKGRSLYGKFLKFWEPHYTQISPRSASFADMQLSKWIRKGSLRSVSALEAALSFDDHKAARGWPWFVSTPHVPFEYLREAESLLADGLRLEHARAYPGVAQTRGQAQGRGLPASWRGIFGMSCVTNILKRMLYPAVRNAIIGTTKFCAWRSRAAVDLAVNRMLKDPAGGLLLSVDFSNFDASIPNEVIDRMFRILAFWFHGSDAQLVRFCGEAFKRTGIYLPDLYLSGSDRQGGIPSGSVLTNLIGSMVNYWVMSYSSHRLGSRVIDCLIQGDDGVYRFEGDINFETLSEVLLVELGLVMSPSKCLISSRDVTYLQSTHSLDWEVDGVCVGSRPIMRFLSGNMKKFPLEGDPEWGGVLNAVRTLQQLDNCSGHPSFEHAWKLAWELDYENLYEAVCRLTANDPTLLDRAARVRAMKAGGVSTTVGGLYKSPVLCAIRAEYPKVFGAS